MQKIENPSLNSFVKMNRDKKIANISRVRNRLSKRVSNIINNPDALHWAGTQFAQIQPIHTVKDANGNATPQNVGWSHLDQLTDVELNRVYGSLHAMDNSPSSTVKGAKQILQQQRNLVGSSQFSQMSDNDRSAFWRAFTRMKDMKAQYQLASDQLLTLVHDANAELGLEWSLSPVQTLNNGKLETEYERDRFGNIKTYADGKPIAKMQLTFQLRDSTGNVTQLDEAGIHDFALNAAPAFAALPQEVKNRYKDLPKHYKWFL